MARLRDYACTRSGDKGSSSNIGVLAHDEESYNYLKEHLTAEKIQDFFSPLGAKETVRYELDNLLALNFIIKDVLQGGGSVSLRTDSQGKGFGQLILEMKL